MKLMIAKVFFFLQCCILQGVTITSYENGTAVRVFVSSLHPKKNPGEKYKYDDLPWPCREENLKSTTTFAEYLEGERLAAVPEYPIAFKVPVNEASLCGEVLLTPLQLKQFHHAINWDYQYQMLIDDLPVSSQVGVQTMIGQNFLSTHRHFRMFYNSKYVISAVVMGSINKLLPAVGSGESLLVNFTYSVLWIHADVPHEHRMEFHIGVNKYHNVGPHHWMSMLKSALVVIILAILVSVLLLKLLKNDLSRYLEIDQMAQKDAAASRAEGDSDDYNENGWKRIRFYVFRSPSNPMLFSSIFGVGVQILITMATVCILGVIGLLFPGNQGTILVAFMLVYAITSYIAGWVSARMYKQLNGNAWVFSYALTASLFVIPTVIIFAVVNSVAISWNSTIALPFEIIMLIILLKLCVTFPLALFGHFKGFEQQKYDWPCIVSQLPPKIAPRGRCIVNPFLYLILGTLPFCPILVELRTVFDTVYSDQWYSLFGIFAISFVSMIIITALSGILLCYVELNAEDPNWWWPSLLRGASTGIFLELFAIYYYNYHTEMSGSLQGCIYFGYTLLVSYAVSLMNAAVGHLASSIFVHKIYAIIKAD